MSNSSHIKNVCYKTKSLKTKLKSIYNAKLLVPSFKVFIFNLNLDFSDVKIFTQLINHKILVINKVLIIMKKMKHLWKMCQKNRFIVCMEFITSSVENNHQNNRQVIIKLAFWAIVCPLVQKFRVFYLFKNG
jgi:hypothetical protein